VQTNVKNIVKNNAARFSFYRAGYMYYEVAVDGQLHRFPVSLEDLGTATLLAEHKAGLLHPLQHAGCSENTYRLIVSGGVDSELSLISTEKPRRLRHRK
jgi:hypothetical protein